MASGTIILFPTEMEAAPLRRLRPDARIAICGVGMAACAAAVAALLPQLAGGQRLILAGIAGAYGERAAVGEAVEVVCERTAELPGRFVGEYRPTGVATGLRGVASNTVHGRGCEAGEASIENMEGAAFFAVCRAAGVCCAEIRAVSNRVGDDFSLWRIDEALAALTAALADTI
ncbi:futalosine hydrolase [Alistipes sp.]|jgi:nucleoside phosphorylase|nr:futalosine hydrolase [Alistipes sp.]